MSMDDVAKELRAWARKIRRDGTVTPHATSKEDAALKKSKVSGERLKIFGVRVRTGQRVRAR